MFLDFFVDIHNDKFNIITSSCDILNRLFDINEFVIPIGKLIHYAFSGVLYRRVFTSLTTFGFFDEVNKHGEVTTEIT